ncbi:HNH endonuclease [Mycolicibacterium chitae]|uniref:HNH nuclease n=1 Tax=Mycolicibacterium chitae TaxID=1792 RepID=A0A448I583_MYCCI|nr:HNH endonuclease domain-containing protein [Mycolicibacterium chitae]MCV7105295.1 HNH endonuclease [Mycolicibacterium chitae]BBZ03852.1 HNH endonuclease [Mycolicibacterium chitae]VEG47503.1 HNH nuclease [Mycolicibacterium chitae]
MTEAGDPLLLGQRVVAILETGLRTATYKLATLMALIEHCVENLPTDPADALQVPIPALAHRVLEIYWHQVRPFDGHELRQSTQPKARILAATTSLRDAAGVGRGGFSVDTARLRAPEAYQRAIDDVALCLAQQPLHRLQKLPGASTSDAFLYDDSFLHDHVSRSTLRARGDAIVLNPGVAHGLARLAGLLKPALEIMWVDDVRRMNKFLAAEVPDVAGHLFGRERTALTVVRGPFKEAFGPHCFYCQTHLPANNPIDHVLPWSLVGIDGLANLVLACSRCNGDKSGSLPAVAIVDRVLERDQGVLEDVAASLQWPTQHPRVVAAARGIYLGQPAGVPTWSGYRRSERLDVSFPPWWVQP